MTFTPPSSRGPFTFPAPYGTQGIRLTDGLVAPTGCAPRNYPYYSVVNNHRGQRTLLVLIGRRDGARPLLLEVQKSTGLVGVGAELPFEGEAEGWYWSDTRPFEFYLCQGPLLRRYNVMTLQAETVFTLDPKYGASLWQPHSSADDLTHSATVRDAAYRDVGCVVVEQRGPIQAVTFVPKPDGYDECQVDKSGRYLVIKEGPDDEHRGVDNRIVDLDNGAVERTILHRGGAVGHSDCGDGTLIGEDDSGDRWSLVRWDLRAPSAGRRELLRGPATWGSGMGHNAVRGERVLVSRPDELIVVSTDGSQHVTRVAPSLLVPRVGVGEPYDWQPKASWDPLGEWACWLGNRAGTDRLDAYLVHVPGASAPPITIHPPQPGGPTVSPLETLKTFRKTYPTPMSNDQIGQLLNAVSWAHRAEGLGMFAKPNGANVRQPRTGILISRDYLVFKDGRGYDVLIDAEGKGTPTWGRVHAMDINRWVAPVDVSVVPDRPPTPDTPPTSGGGTVKPYDESKAVEFGTACNAVYRETAANIDAGLIAVFAQRAAYDYYVGGLAWPASLRKHIAEFRKVYGL